MVKATRPFFAPLPPNGDHYVYLARHLVSGNLNVDTKSNGLFGVLNVEPPGSSYLNMTTGAPLESGWEASIVPGGGKPSFA